MRRSVSCTGSWTLDGPAGSGGMSEDDSEDSTPGSPVLSVFLYTQAWVEAMHRVHELPGCPSHRTFKVAHELLGNVIGRTYTEL